MPKRVTPVVRSVRLDQHIDELLLRDSQEERISYNALIMKILRKYAEWDRFAEKFGFVQIPNGLFANLVDIAPLEQLAETGRGLGRNVRENVRFWFKEVNLRTLLEYTALLFRYAMGGSAEYDVKTDGRDYAITVHHKLGQKWSSMFQVSMSEAFKNMLGITPQFDITKNDVVMRFQANVN